MTAAFDDMLVRSVPLYRETIDLACRLAAPHLRAGDSWLDLGCSRGNVIAEAHSRFGERPGVRFVGVDESRDMVQAAIERFSVAPYARPEPRGTDLTDESAAAVRIVQADLRLGFPAAAGRPRVITCMWTAQFVPIEHRQSLFRSCRESLAPGGALLVAEKLRGQNAAFQDAIVRHYHDWKVRVGGYPVEQVARKARSLEGVLVPMDAPQMKGMLTAEGFAVEEVTRYLGFASWYCLPR